MPGRQASGYRGAACCNVSRIQDSQSVSKRFCPSRFVIVQGLPGKFLELAVPCVLGDSVIPGPPFEFREPCAELFELLSAELLYFPLKQFDFAHGLFR